MHWLYVLALAGQGHEMHGGHEITLPDKVSLFNHHLAGVLVILLGVFTYLEQTELSKQRWVKFLWPLPLLFLGTYLMIWSDNPQFWPFQLSRWARHWTAVQHKIFALLALLLGAIELLRRTGQLRHPGWRHILNALMLGAGLFLFFHGGEHHSHIVHLQHLGMGAVAVAASLAKIASDVQSTGAPGGGSTNRSGHGWLYAVPALMVVLGLQLVLYFE
jgi:hypothetical protein